MRKILFLLLFSIVFRITKAQSGYTVNGALYGEGGPEFQVYPAGQIYTLKYGFNFYNTAVWHQVNIRLGYNRAFRKDFGINDDERGGGFGFSFGYQYTFQKGIKHLFIGPRFDFWWLKINWKDHNSNPVEGTSKITVFQPTAEIGYRIVFNGYWFATLSLAFGREINIITKGKPVGQGGISLAGISISRSIF